ncbi:DUF4097 family beta strand repeat-containing protein [Catellatospora sp. KI3]|uniref:DUF4097 family beta strand repeat-containing protein n=1 Tax=Catellatospora sp. KI3 TaxID=3041620 RepID=UPI0024822993|nr:DUF4097 family beta strand repeat-containing protein [Catellatospora sp. KI3]MDI1461595.1 DUF4097 family beta strand repeat-containing protein [Catellatospora sp. KI3]
MPTFDTPEPIIVDVQAAVAEIRVYAAERTDTVVTVRPSNNNAKSVKLAEQTRVEFTAGRLLIRTPKASSMFGKPGSIDVEVHVPTGSGLEGSTSLGSLRATGRLGECRFRTGYGDLSLQHTGPLQAGSGAGDLSVDRVDGDAEAGTGTGRLRVGHVTGSTVLKSSNGDVWLGKADGPARVNAANGSITVGRAGGGLTAKTAHGGVRVEAAVRGQVVLQTAAGKVEVGIPEGTAAWLDLDATGAVRNELASADGPQETDEKVEIRARTHWGDIIIHRS